MNILKLSVRKLRKDTAQAFEYAVLRIDGVTAVETWVGRADIRMRSASAAPKVIAALREAGFDAHVDAPFEVRIEGMTCRACEITVERRLKKTSGVKSVEVNAVKGIARIVTDGTTPDIAALQEAVANDGYRIRGVAGAAIGERPSLPRLVGLFGIVFLLGALFSKLGIDKTFDSSGPAGFASALVIGLVAGSSSCMAVSGGLLLSAAGTFRKARSGTSTLRGMTPVFLFVGGRILSYGLLGGVIGAVGNALQPSPLVTGAVTVLAAMFMLIMGLDMLKIAPRWLISLLPRTPKVIAHRILDAEGNVHPAMPFLLGAATFFIPCGFTQSFQIYALASGSFLEGATVLAGFAVGTSPALLALGWASSSLKGKAGKIFFQFSGALVVVLGLWNVQNGFIVAGYPLSLPKSGPSAVQSGKSGPIAGDPNVIFDGTTQVIKMQLGADPFYLPSNEYTVRAGIPVRMEIAGIGTGCRTIFQIPKFDVRIALSQPLNVAEFTPDKTGDAVFSCSMGMFRGTLHVRARS